MARLDRLYTNCFRVDGTDYVVEMYWSTVFINGFSYSKEVEWISYDTTLKAGKRVCLRFPTLERARAFWDKYETEADRATWERKDLCDSQISN